MQTSRSLPLSRTTSHTWSGNGSAFSPSSFLNARLHQGARAGARASNEVASPSIESPPSSPLWDHKYRMSTQGVGYLIKTDKGREVQHFELVQNEDKRRREPKIVQTSFEHGPLQLPLLCLSHLSLCGAGSSRSHSSKRVEGRKGALRGNAHTSPIASGAAE